jgi:prophage antirepressor-like protein
MLEKIIIKNKKNIKLRMLIYKITSIMDIIKAFNSNNLHTEITIKGTQDDPLFRASDIALILDIKQIRSSIQDYDNDEKVVEKLDTLGGPQEITFLTELGLYRLLNRSNKPIARDFQKWVAKVIKEIRLTETYKLEKELNEKEKQLTKKEEELSRYKKRNQIKYEKKDRVYVYEDTTNENELVYKIGYSQNMTIRSDTYDICRFENKLKFDLVCSNGRLLEMVVHHILKNKQDCEKKEWFHTNLEIIKKTIITAKFMLDDFMTNEMTNSDINYKLDEINNFLNIETDKNEIVENEIVENEIVENEIIENEIIENEIIENEIIPNINENINDKYDNFFLENCILDEREESETMDVMTVFRKWNDGCSIIERSELLKYLKDNYKQKRVINKKTNKSKRGFIGFKLKNNGYNPTGPLSIYNKYILENCFIDHKAKVTMLNIINDFTNWLKNNKLDNNISKKIIELKKHLLEHFAIIRGSFNYNGKNETSTGLYGIGLNSEEDCLYKKKIRPNQKKVYKVDPKTNELLCTYDSITEARNTLNYNISNRVVNRLIHHDGYLYTFINPNEDKNINDTSNVEIL